LESMRIAICPTARWSRLICVIEGEQMENVAC
jgi:hypothetical protein